MVSFCASGTRTGRAVQRATVISTWITGAMQEAGEGAMLVEVESGGEETEIEVRPNFDVNFLCRQ